MRGDVALDCAGARCGVDRAMSYSHDGMASDHIRGTTEKSLRRRATRGPNPLLCSFLRIGPSRGTIIFSLIFCYETTSGILTR